MLIRAIKIDMGKDKNSKKNTTVNDLEIRTKELEENWRRALADYHNLEKRIDHQQKKFVKLATASLIDKLLGVLDDLERAVVHIKEKGIELIIEQFQEVLESEGVEEIEALNKEFDPETMDCVEMVPGKKNKVVNIQLKGYKLYDRVIRPVKVEVGTGHK